MDKMPMMHHEFWLIALISSFVLILFIYSMTKLRTERHWWSFTLFSLFIVDHFIEMYIFPMTAYWISCWFPTHPYWSDFFSYKGNPHLGLFHILSLVTIAIGLLLTANAWGVLKRAQNNNTLATTGPYAYSRHPQYLGFMLIMLGLILHWPTLITLILFLILGGTYIYLAFEEEAELEAKFGDTYRVYATNTPRFIPRLFRAVKS